MTIIILGSLPLITGELAKVTTFVTFTQGVILRVHLHKAMTAEVQLFIQYTDIYRIW